MGADLMDTLADEITKMVTHISYLEEEMKQNKRKLDPLMRREERLYKESLRAKADLEKLEAARKV